MYGTHAVSVPSHDAGYADALAADIIGAATNPQPNATAAMSFMVLAYVPGRRLPQQSPQSAPPTTLTSHEMAPRRGASRYGGRRSCATCQRRRGGISRQRACAAGLQLPERRRRNRLRQQYLRSGRGEDELWAAGRPGHGRRQHGRLLPGGAYLINQAVNELCPAQIWQLRQSAAGYTLPS